MSLLRRIAGPLGLLFLLAVIGVATATVRAQQQQSASGLQISPTKQELSLEPGEVKQVSFVVKNITAIEITAKTTLNDFESDNLTGEPKLIIDNSKRTSYSLEKFIKGFEDVDLKPGESKEIKITIDVPGDATPGAYFGALRFDATPKGGRPDSERQVALTASVAPLLLVQVNGDIKEQIEIISVSAQKNNKPSKFFVSAPDKNAVTIKNLGNSFSRPFGRIMVQNMRGKEVSAYELNNTTPRGTVLPSSTRTFTDSISGVKSPGRYRITASIAHGAGGEVINYQTSFWYVPLWMIVILVALLAGVALFGYMTYKRRYSRTSSKR